jgi:hypothetical protein
VHIVLEHPMFRTFQPLRVRGAREMRSSKLSQSPIPVAARSKAWICSLFFAGIAGSNSAGVWMSVSCECCVLPGRVLCIGLITRPEESYRVWYVWMWSRKPRRWAGLGPLQTVQPWKTSFFNFKYFLTIIINTKPWYRPPNNWCLCVRHKIVNVSKYPGCYERHK